MSHLCQRMALRAATTAVVGAIWVCGQPALAQTPAKAAPANPIQPAVPPTNPAELSGNRGIDNRLDRDEKTLRDLRQIVLQATATHQPVEVREAGPDPLVAELQSKLDDLNQTLGRMNGQLDTLGHNLDLASKALAEAVQANTALAARLDKLEAAVQTLQTPPPAAAAAPAGALGQLPASGPAVPADPGAAPGPADEILAYRQARGVLDAGDYAGGVAALQDYLARYPTSPRAAEANYWLGRTLALRNMHPDAAAAYARSLKGWPETPWAGDAVVRLSTSLIEMKRPEDACKALVEFDSRYAAKSAAAVKTRAKDSRTRAACS
jgi:tol-pal system protein YbgF